MMMPGFRDLLKNVEVEAYPCLDCSALPTADVALLVLAARDPRERKCPVCGQGFRIARADLRHRHDAVDATWCLGLVTYDGVVKIAQSPAWVHAHCADARYPLQPRRESRGGRLTTLINPVKTARDLPLDPLKGGAVDAPPRYFGAFGALINSDGLLELPRHWVAEVPGFFCFRSPVDGENCARLYDAVGWKATSASMRRLGTSLPPRIYSIPVDPMGKLKLPDALLCDVGLVGEVHVEAMCTWLEVWPLQEWRSATCLAGPRHTLWEGVDPWSIE